MLTRRRFGFTPMELLVASAVISDAFGRPDVNGGPLIPGVRQHVHNDV